MYEQQSGPEPGGCRETLLLIRIAFSVLLPPMLAIAGVVVLIVVFFMLFAVHPLFGLLPFVLIGGGLYWLARRERSRDPDFDDLRRRR
jgi:hypothetical protein